MAPDTFRRYELKYLMNTETYEQLLHRLEEYMEVDDYSKRTGFYLITNLYYDTPNDSLIRASISKPVYKEKLRVRSYGIPDEHGKVFLEIKKKYKRLVSKRRITLPAERAYAFLRNEDDLRDYPGIDMQKLREFEYFRSLYPLIPKVYLSYERKALYGKADPEFRVTFDKNITARRYDLTLEQGVYGEQLLPEDKWLMEVKVLGAAPLWFAKLLSELKIYPTSFSKYGTEYRRYVAGKRQVQDVGTKEVAAAKEA